MKFFTNEKFAKNTSHSEYEAYCREKWRLIPDELKIINKGMLPEEMLLGLESICLHDARIISVKNKDNSIIFELNTDNSGELHKVFLEYCESKIIVKPNENVLGSKPEDPDSDIMCHEIGIESNGEYTHTVLFASEDELQINFSRLIVEFLDAA